MLLTHIRRADGLASDRSHRPETMTLDRWASYCRGANRHKLHVAEFGAGRLGELPVPRRTIFTYTGPAPVTPRPNHGSSCASSICREIGIAFHRSAGRMPVILRFAEPIATEQAGHFAVHNNN